MTLAGKAIFCDYDQYGPVRVFDDGQRRCLSFGEGDEQSLQLKADPALLQHDYTRAMLLALLFGKPKHVTVLGVGGGALLLALLKLLPSAKITAVELRPLVLQVAQRFFQVPRSKRLELICDDALDYLAEAAEGSADLLMSDLYSAEGMVNEQLQSPFLDDCQRVLKANGWLVLNCWREHRRDGELLPLLRERFAQVHHCSTADGNWIILAGKSTLELGQRPLADAAKRLSKEAGFSFTAMLGRLQSH